MTRFGKCFLAIAAIIAGVAVCAPAPDASNAHFAIVNNSDFYFPSYGYTFRHSAEAGWTEGQSFAESSGVLASGAMSQEINEGDS